MPKFPHCHVVVDGSNVVARPNGVPILSRLLIVRDALKKQGCESIDLIVDPTLKTTERLADGDRIRLKEMIRNNEIIEAPSEADPWIINRAKNRDGFVVSNDQFRDHGHQWSILPARLIGFMFAETGCTFQTPQGEMLEVEIAAARPSESTPFVVAEPAPPSAHPARRTGAPYQKDEDITIFYLYRFGDKMLPMSEARIAALFERTPGAISFRKGNFKALDGKGGFGHYAPLSKTVYKEFSNVSQEGHRGHVITILESWH